MCESNDKSKNRCVSVVLTPEEYKLIKKQAKDMKTSVPDLLHTAWVNYYGLKGTTKGKKEPKTKSKSKKRKYSDEDMLYIME